MKNLNLRSTMLSVCTGVIFALVLAFASFTFTKSANAGDWCPSPPAGCAISGCYNLGGGKKCKYYNTQNGVTCSDTGCTTAPGGGGDEPVVPTEQ